MEKNKNNEKIKSAKISIIPIVIIILILLVSIGVIAGKYYLSLKEIKEFSEIMTIKVQENIDQLLLAADLKKKNKKPNSKDYINSSIKLVAHSGQIFSAKIPEGWKFDENIGGINISNPDDSDIDAFLIALPQAPGKSSPDEFLETIIKWEGLTDVKYVSESDEKTTTFPQSPPFPDFVWKEKSKTFTCKKGETSFKIKSVVGNANIYGSHSAIAQGFKTPLEKWNEWSPLMERVASSIIITNPQKVGGKDKVILPSAKDLANDSSPLMDAWNYRNQVQDKASHDFSDAIMGVESDLISPSTGQSYTLPLSNYDPTEGGYHNPNNYSEILIDLYK